jgi:hypothetical protein
MLRWSRLNIGLRSTTTLRSIPMCVPADGGALILTDDQALKIINLACSWQQGSPLRVSV